MRARGLTKIIIGCIVFFVCVIIFLVAFIYVFATCDTILEPILPGFFFPFYFAFEYGWGNSIFLSCLVGDFFMIASLITEIICIIQIVIGIRLISGTDSR